MSAKTAPPVEFYHPCDGCRHTIRYVNGRPLKHNHEHHMDSKEATPWA